MLSKRRTTEFHVCWLFVWLNTVEKEKTWSFSLFQMTSGCIHVRCFLFSGRYITSLWKSCNEGVTSCCLSVSNKWMLSSHTLGWHLSSPLKTPHDLYFYVLKCPFLQHMLFSLCLPKGGCEKRYVCALRMLFSKNAVWGFSIYQERMKTAAYLPRTLTTTSKYLHSNDITGLSASIHGASASVLQKPRRMLPQLQL